MSHGSPPPADPAAATRAAAGAEIALAMGLPAQARRRAQQALCIDSACRRAHAVLLGIADARAARPPQPPPAIPGRVVAKYAGAAGGDLTLGEARTILQAYLDRGRRRTRMPRRLGGGTLDPGVTVLGHHRRPDLGILVREGRIVDIVQRDRAR